MTYHCLPFFPCYLLSQAMPAIQAAAERFGHRSQLLPQLAAASSWPRQAAPAQSARPGGTGGGAASLAGTGWS